MPFLSTFFYRHVFKIMASDSATIASKSGSNTHPTLTRPTTPRPLRTVWISDVHLGTPECKAAYLLDFLQHHRAETLYLVGDIVDGLQLKRSWYWDPDHERVIHAVLEKATEGTKVVYIPGNHDEAMRSFPSMRLGGVLIAKEWIHTTACGKRLLVFHGDAVDGSFSFARWLALLGDWTYKVILWANTLLNRWLRVQGRPYWSLSRFIKSKSKNAQAYIELFERSIAHLAKRRNLDGVVCGHIHHPRIRYIDGVLYCNDGDWVENCSALAEHPDGTLEVLYWPWAASVQANSPTPAHAPVEKESQTVNV